MSRQKEIKQQKEHNDNHIHHRAHVIVQSTNNGTGPRDEKSSSHKDKKK